MAESDKMRRLQMEHKRMEERIGWKEEEYKLSGNEKLKEDALELLLTDVQTKIGII